MKLFSIQSLERRVQVLVSAASRRNRSPILVFAVLLTAVSGCANSGFVVPLTAENRGDIGSTLVVLVNADIRGYGKYEYYARPSESGPTRVSEAIGIKTRKFGYVSYPWALHEIDYNTSFTCPGGGYYKWNTEDLGAFYKRAFTSLRSTLKSFSGDWTPEEMVTCIADSLKSDFSICGSTPTSVVQALAAPMAGVAPLPLRELCLPIANKHSADTVLVIQVEYEMNHKGHVIQSWPRVFAALYDMDNQETLYKRLIRGNGIWLDCDIRGVVASEERKTARERAKHSATFLEDAIKLIVADLR